MNRVDQRKICLRDNLIAFGKEFLTPFAFNRLIKILKEGGVDLLPMNPPKTTRKEKKTIQKVRKIVYLNEPVSDPLAVLQNFKSEISDPAPQLAEIKQEIFPESSQSLVHDAFEIRILPDQNSRVPTDGFDQIQHLILPFENERVFEETNAQAEEDPIIYNLCVLKFRNVFQVTFLQGGWEKVFDNIFGWSVINHFHYMKASSEFVRPEGVRKPVHNMILIKDGLKDAFPKVDPGTIKKELKEWFSKRRHKLRSKKYYKKIKSNQPRQRQYLLVDVEPLVVPFVEFSKIDLPIETDIHFEQINQQLETDSTFRKHVIDTIRQIYAKNIQNGGWVKIFDDIFGRGFTSFYHFMRDEKRAILTEDGAIRRSICDKFLIQNVFPEAFSQEDLTVAIKEFKSWFRTRRRISSKKSVETDMNDDSMESNQNLDTENEAKDLDCPLKRRKRPLAKRSTSKSAIGKRRTNVRPAVPEEQTLSDVDEDEPLATFTSYKRLRYTSENDRINDKDQNESMLELVSTIKVEDTEDFVLE